MSVYFWQKVDEKIAINSSRAIRNPRSKVTSTRLNNCNIFDSVSRVSPWNFTTKGDDENLVENLRDNNIFKNAGHTNNF